MKLNVRKHLTNAVQFVFLSKANCELKNCLTNVQQCNSIKCTRQTRFYYDTRYFNTTNCIIIHEVLNIGVAP
jgi:hypothetical protein